MDSLYEAFRLPELKKAREEERAREREREPLKPGREKECTTYPWRCSCGIFNLFKATTCGICGKKNPSGVQK